MNPKPTLLNSKQEKLVKAILFFAIIYVVIYSFQAQFTNYGRSIYVLYALLELQLLTPIYFFSQFYKRSYRPIWGYYLGLVLSSAIPWTIIYLPFEVYGCEFCTGMLVNFVASILLLAAGVLVTFVPKISDLVIKAIIFFAILVTIIVLGSFAWSASYGDPSIFKEGERALFPGLLY